MIKYLLSSLILFSSVASAVFSKFVHLTPDNRAEYQLPICVTSATETVSTKRIVFQLFQDSDKHAWLIVSKEYLYSKDQEFRDYIWSDQKYNANIEARVKINNVENKDIAEVIISDALMDRSYIYIDFPYPVFDGGYYYSIDLSKFKEIDDGEC